MDKRSLLFIACITASYCAVQFFFGTGAENSGKSIESKAAIERLEKTSAAEQERLSRTATLEDLSLVELFFDPLGRVKAGTSVKLDETHYMTLAWQSTLPAKLYVPTKDTFDVLTLHGSTQHKVGEVAFFLKEGAAQKPVELPPVPLASDLHLLPLGGTLEVVLAEQKKADLLFPYTYLDRPAIAFVKKSNTYLPVGVYEPAKNKVISLGELDSSKTVVQQASVPLAAAPDASETFYVLETDYQQLVFSTRGGSLAEINLPLKTSKDSKSLIKEIDIGRKILADSPQNAHFPLHPYQSASGEQVRGSLGGYYPLLRRPIMNADETQRTSISPQFYALNILGENGNGSMNYRVEEFSSRRIKFVGSDGGRRITKTYTIPQERNGPYCFDLEIDIDGEAGGLWLTSGVPDVELVGGSYAPQLKYQVRSNRGTDIEEIKLPKEGSTTDRSITPYWLSNCNGFLGLIVDPLTPMPAGYKVEKISGAELPTRLTTIDATRNLYPAADYPGYMTSLPLSSGVSQFRVFAGPYDEGLLKDLDNLYSDPKQNYNPEYTEAISMQGWFSFISQPFAKFLFLLMQLFYAITNSWAISIILLTIALRVMMYPLNSWSIRTQMRNQEMAPKIKAIQERYKNDPVRANKEKLNLYKQSGVNPLGGCLPMFLQIPFFMGMFYMLKSSFSLRGAVFIPGWIDDLTAPDVLFSWDTPIWMIGNEFHLLPILSGLVMYVQGKVMQKLPTDGTPLTDAQKQQKMMGNIMAIMFAVLFYNVSSGLNIYMMISTLMGILQQKFLMNKTTVKK